MGSRTDANGETASLKKRKREPKDEASPSLKRHRAKPKRELDRRIDDGTVNGGKSRPGDALSLQTNGDLKLRAASARAKPEAPKQKSTPWKLSKPMGGRMLDIDPMFSPDEKHLILAYNTSVQVYNTADSLLVRRIAFPTATTGKGGFVVAAALSKSSPEHIWVATSNGHIWYINWTSGVGSDAPFSKCRREILDVAIESVGLGDTTKDVLLVLQKHESSKAQVFAYDDKALSTSQGTLIHTLDGRPHLLRAAAKARVAVVAAGTTLHIGFLNSKSRNIASIGDLEYRFYSFHIPDLVASLDIQTSTRSTKKGGIELQQVDLALGGARGGIYLYADVASKLPAEGSKSLKGGFIHPRKHHWHRKAVHSVKWSSDGNYLVSGGSEQVLVLWQLDTGKRTFLPHLSGAIENITISPRGSSYAIRLDDNSAMVITTEEMVPTTYVSGIQSISFGDRPPKDSLVRRVWQPTDQISAPLVAATNPLNPSQVFLCVGNGQQATLGGGGPSTPQLQVFDIVSFQGVMKHAIARTNITEANITSQGAPIVEPTVTKLAFSGDGKWIASVDEWQPPKGDAEVFLTGSKTHDQVRRERREIYLKFWQAGPDGKELQLVTRVNEPHHTYHPEAIFDLASDPSSPRFATLGDDGVVRFWSSKLRSVDGVATTGSDGQHLRIWTCSRAVVLPVHVQQDVSAEPMIRRHRSGALTFSEDGSILFAAYGEPSEAVVFAIDTGTGDVRETLYGVFRGEVRSIRSLGSCLVMLSEDLNVYDIVSDELLYSFTLKETSAAAKRLTQLAVNKESRSFAVAAPIPGSGQKTMKKGVQSELVVFSIDDPDPIFTHTFPQLITSVLPAASSSGFMIVDSAAQIWSVTEGTEKAPILQPLVDLGVSEEAEVNGQPLTAGSGPEDGEASDEEMKDGDEDVDMEMDEDLDIYPAVVAPQRLADIFNTAPAFAMPPIEDVFYQVAGLFSSKPMQT